MKPRPRQQTLVLQIKIKVYIQYSAFSYVNPTPDKNKQSHHEGKLDEITLYQILACESVIWHYADK